MLFFSASFRRKGARADSAEIQEELVRSGILEDGPRDRSRITSYLGRAKAMFDNVRGAGAVQCLVPRLLEDVVAHRATRTAAGTGGRFYLARGMRNWPAAARRLRPARGPPHRRP
jgi:hypothetical protein